MTTKERFSYYKDTNKIECAVSIIENVMHKDFDVIKNKDRPAFMTFYNTTNTTLHKGNVKCKRYFRYGKYYRTGDKPHEILYFDVKTKAEGKIQFEFYRNENGELHREPKTLPDGTLEDQPAVVEYYPGPAKQIKFLAYYKNGKLQRISGQDKPTHMQYYEVERSDLLGKEAASSEGRSDENIEDQIENLEISSNPKKGLEYEVYSKDGITHREPDEFGIDQPAYFKYDRDGKTTYEAIYKDGVLHKSITTS